MRRTCMCQNLRSGTRIYKALVNIEAGKEPDEVKAIGLQRKRLKGGDGAHLDLIVITVGISPLSRPVIVYNDPIHALDSTIRNRRRTLCFAVGIACGCAIVLGTDTCVGA